MRYLLWPNHYQPVTIIYCCIFQESPASAISSSHTAVIRDPAKVTDAAALFQQGYGPYQPKRQCPTDSKGRRFSYKWYVDFKWLEYSPHLDKAYCFPCRVFNRNNHNDLAFVSTGFQNWKRALEKFRAHEKSFTHKSAFQAWYAAQQAQNNPEKNVLSLINLQHKKTVEENRQYLKAIIDTIIFLGKQGISFRGHRENDESLNKGNFLELLTFRSKDNSLISRFFANKEKFVTYTSHNIQNELLDIIAESIRAAILNNIKNAGMFALILDDSLDISKHEQAAVIMRYVDTKFVVNENFLGFFRVVHSDGESLYQLIQTVLSSFELSIQDIVAQCYDGAANMRGEYKGVASRIKIDNKRAIYIHCNAHILNLILVDVAKSVVGARNTFGTITELHNFIDASGKRHAVFEEIQIESGGRLLTLKGLSDTRWACRSEALKAIRKRLSEVIDSLEKIAQEDAAAGGQAQGLLNAITFDFIFHLIVLDEVFNITKVLSKYLQHINISICAARQKVNAVLKSLQELRTDSEFNKHWKEANEISKKLQLEGPKLPRQRRVPSRLGGGEAQPACRDVKHYFKINSYYPVLDVMIGQIQERFSENDMEIIQHIETILLADNVSTVSLQVFEQVSQFYDIDKDNLKAELRVFTNLLREKHQQQAIGQSDENYKVLCERKDVLSDNGTRAVFPVLSKLMQIFWTIPITSCSAERSFSCLRRLKNYLRNTMGQERLSALALINIEKEIAIDADKVVDDFAKNSSRKLQLSYT